MKLTASKVLELAPQWPGASPLRHKVVLLGGSYLDQDWHDTPIGRMHGVEVMANVIETELQHGGGQPAPGKAVVFVLEIFESFALILLFHLLRLRWALLASLALVPMVSILCSLVAYGNCAQVTRFAPILVGLIIYELYDHFRRSAAPRVYQELAGGSSHAPEHR
jgi:CHASE2 domain-containing sensor protein